MTAKYLKFANVNTQQSNIFDMNPPKEANQIWLFINSLSDSDIPNPMDYDTAIAFFEKMETEGQTQAKI